MRIWAFPSFYPIERPGLKWVGIFAHRQYKALVENGAELCVIQPVLWHPPYPLSKLNEDWNNQQQKNYPHKRTYDGITVYHPRIANLKPGRIFNKPYSQRYVEAIVQFFKKEGIQLSKDKDIFYAQWIPDAAMVQQAAHQLGIRAASLLIGDDVLVWPFENEKNLLTFCNTMRNSDIRLAVAGYLANEANQLTGEGLPYTIIRRGVNHNFFKPAKLSDKINLRNKFGIPQNKTVILSIGSVIVRKGWLDLLDALSILNKTNSDFLLVAAHGGKPDFDLKAEANNRGLYDNLLDLGEVDPKEIDGLYNSADIFCLASHWEGIANSVVEAMSSGLPVLTTNVCGHPELIENGITGILVDPKSPTQLAEALLKMLNDAEFRNLLASNARTFIVNHWGDFAFNARKLFKTLSESSQS
jgi:glycosyltransferase involved in cell wall biosynthesis